MRGLGNLGAQLLCPRLGRIFHQHPSQQVGGLLQFAFAIEQGGLIQPIGLLALMCDVIDRLGRSDMARIQRQHLGIASLGQIPTLRRFVAPAL